MKNFLISSICLFMILLVSNKGFSLVAGPYYVEGTLKSVDAKTLKIDTPESVVTVPRQLVAEKNLKVDSKVRVEFLPDQLGLLHFAMKQKK
jgi:hypothetical protein